MTTPEPTISRPVRRGFHRSDIMSLLLFLALIVGVLELIPSNYYLLMPGEARPVSTMIHVQGARRVQSRGGLYMTDVSIYKVNHKLEELYGRLNSNYDLEPVQAVAGNLNEKQYLQYNAQLMDQSILEAEVSALGAVGRYHPGCIVRPQIVLILRTAPAARLL